MKDLTFVREELVDGVGPWVWIKGDTGAWTGPKDDWETSHKGVIEKYCKNYNVVIQAGGNCGMYPKLYAKMFKRVYTFEPDPLNFYCLTQNCTEEHIVKIQAALSESHHMINVQRHDMSNVGMHTVKAEETGIIPAFTIDDLNLKSLDLIHLDIEDSEQYALLGASETLKTHRPILLLEKGNKEPIITFLTSLGYKYVQNSKSDAVWIPMEQ